MKQSVISKSQVAKSHLAVQWLMQRVTSVSPRQKKIGTNTIKNHLVLHLSVDMLDHGVPQNVNSAYAKSAHSPLAKDTTRRTQRCTSSFTKQAAHRYPILFYHLHHQTWWATRSRSAQHHLQLQVLLVSDHWRAVDFSSHHQWTMPLSPSSAEIERWKMMT